MPRFFQPWVAGLWVLGAALGCSHEKNCQVCDQGPGAYAISDQSLPLTERGKVDLDLGCLPPTLAIYQAAAGHGRAVPAYHLLTAKDCQCLAAAASSQANLRDQEQELVSAQEKKHPLCGSRGNELAEVRKTILRLEALESRNQSAGKALEHYYHLAEAEAKWNLQQTGVAVIRNALARTTELINQGLRSQTDYEVFHRQRIDLEDDGAEAIINIHKLNGALIQLLAIDTCEADLRLWPCDDFKVAVEPIDMEAAVTEGLAHRPELILLRYLKQQLDPANLPAARQLLQSSDALLGASKKSICPPLTALLAKLHCSSKNETELEVRRRQLDQALAGRERAVTEEIRVAVHTIASQVELVVAGRERVASWEARLRDLEAREAKGTASYPELTAANLEWLRAKGKAVKEVMAWEIARADLKKAQGVLPLECGYDGGCPCCPEPCLAAAEAVGPTVLPLHAP